MVQLRSRDGKLGLCARSELQALGRLELSLDALLDRPTVFASVFAQQERAPLFKLLEPLDPDRAISVDVAGAASYTNGLFALKGTAWIVFLASPISSAYALVVWFVN